MQIEILVWFELQFTKIFSPIRLSICISLTISSLSFSQRDVTDQKKWVETFRTQAWFRFRVVQAHLFCSKAANLRPALGHGCGKQTPSVSILFFRKKLLHVPNVEFYRRVRSRSVRNVQDRNIKDLGLCMTSGFANTEVMHRPRSDYPLQFDIRNMQQIRTGKVGFCSNERANSVESSLQSISSSSICGNEPIVR